MPQVRLVRAVTSSEEEMNQRLESSTEFCAKAVREFFAPRSNGSIPLASLLIRRALLLALMSLIYTSHSTLACALQDVLEI